jgi:hypothetical protein
MKERPLPLIGPMVLATLNDLKTMTRRVMKIQPPDEHYKLITTLSTTGDKRQEGKHHWAMLDNLNIIKDQNIYFSCPYGQPGDHLWVKETWQTGTELDNLNGTEILQKAMDAGYDIGPACPLWYPADGAYRPWCNNDLDFGNTGRKRAARFMPRWASRIILEITGVRVERVQNISVIDCISEGIKIDVPDYSEDAIYRFKQLWDSINAKRGFSWDVNPYVWCISFKRIKP